jgi:hypothetical protein
MKPLLWINVKVALTRIKHSRNEYGGDREF